jgi:dephospho-CoA kinase
MKDKERGKIIGLTGMYCAGKNYIADLLEKRGIPVLDVDKLGHQAIENRKAAIVARFGAVILGDDGAVDRGKLGALVFGRSGKPGKYGKGGESGDAGDAGEQGELAALEAIVHPEANRLTDEWIEAQGGRPCVINAALLHRSSAFERLDALILVKAPALLRLIRARKRDNLPWGKLIRRFYAQRNFRSQYLRGKTDIYIVYNGFPGGDPAGELEKILVRIGMER